MKRNDIIIIIGTLCYSILFYQQLAGINFFLFSLIIILLFLIKQPSLAKSKQWLLAACGTLFSAACIFTTGTTLSVAANIIMLILLCGFSVNSRSGIILNGFFSLYSIGGSLIFMILRWVDPAFRQNEKAENTTPKEKQIGKKFLTFFLPLLLLILFFIIYRAANPVFKNYTDHINLDFISWMWIAFTLGGYFILCGMFFHYRIKALDKWESEKQTHLQFNENKKDLTWINERGASLFLFSILNFMLLFINATDVHFLYMGAKLPEGISHSDFVHNGVGMLILSIIIAVSLILFFFRGNLNFDKKAKPVKWIIYLWILQNILIIISTIQRNNLYVEEFNLTYKRIGVYIYLTLSIAGLITILVKLLTNKNNWFLVRSNSTIGLFLLLGLCPFDLDAFITEWNIKHSQSLASLDKSYLISLSETNLPQLYKIAQKDSFNENLTYHYDLSRNDLSDFHTYDYSNQNRLQEKLLQFLQSCEGTDWRSRNLRRDRLLNDIQLLCDEGVISELNLLGGQTNNFNAYGPIKSLKRLSVTGVNGFSIGDIKVFPVLEQLSLRNCGLTQLDSLPPLASIKELDLSVNPISDYSGLKKVPNTETLHLSNIEFLSGNNFPSLKNLKTIDLNYCQLQQTDFLKYQTNLENLYFSGGKSNKNLPLLSHLKTIDLSNNNLMQQGNAGYNLSQLPNLETLILSNNQLNGTEILYNKEEGFNKSTSFSRLKILHLNANQISFADGLYLFPELEELHLQDNRLYNFPNLQNLFKLRLLNLSGNLIKDLSGLEKNISLKELDLSRNNRPLDFSVLVSLTQLEKLNLSNTFFNKIIYLKEMKYLRELNITDTYVENLEELTSITSLETLHCNTIQVKDFIVIKKLKQMKEIHIARIHPETLTLLKKEFPKLKVIASTENDQIIR